MIEKQLGNEPEKELPKSKVEIESKILNVDLANLETNLMLAGARLEIPERLVADERFSLAENGPVNATLEISAVDEKYIQEFIKAAKELGLTVQNLRTADFFEITGDNINENASVRIRADQGKNFLTVKTDAGTDSHIKKKNEFEPEIINVPAIKEWLSDLGYKVASDREKLRTTYVLNYSGVQLKVEINKSPDPRVKPWIEIEGPEEYIVQTTQLLGFNKVDLFPGTDRDLYLKAGLTEQEIRNIKFPLK